MKKKLSKIHWVFNAKIQLNLKEDS